MPPVSRIAFPMMCVFINHMSEYFRNNDDTQYLANYMREIQININQSALKNKAPTKTSICMYSFLNTYDELVCSKFNLEGTLIAMGMENSMIKMFSVTNNPLKKMKSGQDLERIDKTTGDIHERIIDIESRHQTHNYIGHSAPVQGLAFDFYNKFFLSASQDLTGF